MQLKVTLVHQNVPDGAPADERDVLDEAAAVSAALTAAGHAVQSVSCGLDLQALVDHPAIREADVVFNLVESLGNSGRLIHLVPAVLETVDIPFTGNGAEAQFATSGKLLAKQLLRAAGLPTAAWVVPDGAYTEADQKQPADWIVKSVWEHASVGIDDTSVLRGVTAAAAAAAAGSRGCGCFAEHFIEGREFNVGLLEAADGTLHVLPPAELVFVDYPPDKPRIVGYEAKWHDETFACKHTVRRFVDPVGENDLCVRLRDLAHSCWHLFGLSGYARVDFRADASDNLVILEVNANPCLTPDAGFAAALAVAGIGYNEAVGGLVEAAWRRAKPHAKKPSAALVEPVNEVVQQNIRYRCQVRPSDAAVVRQLVTATGFFHNDEVAVAQELVDEHLAKGEASGYFFIFAERDGAVVGYSCFGPIPCTRTSYALYWIAVDPAAQGGGIGRLLLRQAEAAVRQHGGTRLYAETSGREQYASTRSFYERCGFVAVETLDDFYDVGDARLTYLKTIV